MSDETKLAMESLRQMNEATKLMHEALKQMNAATKLMDNAARQMEEATSKSLAVLRQDKGQGKQVSEAIDKQEPQQFQQPQQPQEKPVQSQDNESTRELSKRSHELLKKGTSSVEGLEQLVNATAKLVEYGSANRLLLTQGKGNDFASREKYEQADPAFGQVDWSKINQVEIFVPKPGKTGEPMQFDTARVYSAWDIKQQYPVLGNLAYQVANQYSATGFFRLKPETRQKYINGVYAQNNVKKPEWVKSPVTAAELRIARYMTEANGRTTNDKFEFPDKERQALAELAPKDLAEVFKVGSGIAKKLTYKVNQQFQVTRKQWQEQHQEQQHEPAKSPAPSKTKAKER